MTDSELAALGGTPTVTTPLPPAWPRYREMARDTAARMIAAGDVYAFGDHPILDELESWARSYFRSPYALATSSGTAALESAYTGLGIRPGDEVLVPTYTFHATATPLFAAGALPVLCDCRRDDARIDPGDVAAKITPRTRAIAVTHMFGLPCDMDELRAIARRHGIGLVEDAAQAHGARYRGAMAGAIGDAGCLSLGGAKMVSGGMGGLLLTAREDVYHAALVLGHSHERALERIPVDAPLRGPSDAGWGRNFRMSPLCAALALDHARTLDQRVAQRTAVLQGLTARLNAFEFFEPPITPPDRTRGGWYGYKVLYRAEALDGLTLDAFVAAVRAEGVRVARPTTRPLHMTWPFRHHDTGLPGYDPGRLRPLYEPGDLPNARSLWERTLAFPDKHLHEPADAVLDEYAAAFAKVRNAVKKYGGRSLTDRLSAQKPRRAA